MNKELQVLTFGEDGEMTEERKNTSISVNEELWNEFCSIVVKKYGNRKNSIILEELIKDYIKKNGGMQK